MKDYESTNQSNQADSSQEKSRFTTQQEQGNHSNQGDNQYDKKTQYDEKDGIQGERSLNPNTRQRDDQMHQSKEYQSHDPKDGIQGEKNNQQDYNYSQGSYGQKSPGINSDGLEKQRDQDPNREF